MCLDYFFLSDEHNNLRPAIVMRHRDTRMIFSYLIPNKGVDIEWTAERLANGVRKLGYEETILKRDPEEAIKPLFANICNVGRQNHHRSCSAG